MTVWIKIVGDVTQEPYGMKIVSTRLEADVLTDAQAQQAVRGATIHYNKYAWRSVRVPTGYVVEGEEK